MHVLWSLVRVGLYRQTLPQNFIFYFRQIFHYLLLRQLLWFTHDGLILLDQHFGLISVKLIISIFQKSDFLFHHSVARLR